VRITALFFVGLAFVGFATPALARNDIYHIAIAPVLSSPEYASRVGSSVKFVFADRPATGYQTLGEYLATQRGHFRGRTEEQACISNFLDALEELRDHAQRAGGDAVIGIVSDYRYAEFSSKTEFECHAGSNGVFVWLKGIFAKAQ
jgi:uncharacterized protein YbjQ (UPF0145 family)